MLKFGWGPGDVAWSLVAVGVLTAFPSRVLPRLLVPRLGETRAVYFGLVCAAPGLCRLCLRAGAAGSLCLDDRFRPGRRRAAGLNAIMSHLVPPDEQGELQGAIASITSLTSVVSLLVMTTCSPGSPAATRRSISRARPFSPRPVRTGALMLFAAAHARKAQPRRDVK